MINNSWLYNLHILKVKEELIFVVVWTQMTVAAVLPWWWHQVKWVWQWQQCCHCGDIKSNECDTDSGSSAVMVVTSSQMSVTVAAVMSSRWHQVKWWWQWQQCCRRADIKKRRTLPASSDAPWTLANWHHLSGQRLLIPATPTTLAKFTLSVRTEAPNSCTTTTTCKIYIVCQDRGSWFLQHHHHLQTDIICQDRLPDSCNSTNTGKLMSCNKMKDSVNKMTRTIINLSWSLS